MEIITGSRSMLPGLVAALLVGIAIVAVTAATLSGWVCVLLITFGSIMELIGALSLAAWLWGSLIGMPWHFTPDPELGAAGAGPLKRRESPG